MADKERYEILKLLGKGRTGGVYEAEDSVLNRKVALRRFFSEFGVHDASKLTDDFTSIAQNLCNLQNPNLLTIFDAGVDEDGAFMVSQLLDGKSLAEHVAQGYLGEWDARDLASQILDALHAAHSAGFVHGALTPGSIMMLDRARGGYRYVILDLGLSRLAPLIQGEGSYLAIMSDPALMPPELFDGKVATEKSDLYMLGQLIYVTLAGGHPFSGLTMEEAGNKHKAGDIPRISDYRPELNPAFIDWIHKLIDPDPEKRPASAQEAAESLPEIAAPVPSTSTTKQQQIKLVTNTAPITHTAGISPVTTRVTTSTAPQALTGKVSVSSTTQNTGVPVAEASSKSLRIVLIVTVLVILSIGVGIFMAFQGGKKLTSAEKAKLNGSTEQVEADPYVMLTPKFKTKAKASPPTSLLKLSKFNTLDWVVLTKLPIQTNLNEKPGKLILDVRPTRNMTPVVFPQPAQKFTTDNGEKLTPSVRLDSANSKLTTQEGWTIKLRAPESVDKGFSVTTFFTTWGCDLTFRVKTEDGKYLEDEFIFESRGKDFTSALNATIHDINPGQIFFIEVEVTKLYQQQSNPAVAINAVKILKN